MDKLTIISKSCEIFFYVGSILIASYTLIVNRSAIFKNTLQEKQIEELCHLRQVVFDVWFDVYFVKGWADNIKALDRSLLEFEKEQPDDWSQYQKFKINCMELFYKLQFPEYYLFPKQLDYKKLSPLHTKTSQFVPFTINALINKDKNDVLSWQQELLNSISYLDKLLRKIS